MIHFIFGIPVAYIFFASIAPYLLIALLLGVDKSILKVLIGILIAYVIFPFIFFVIRSFLYIKFIRKYPNVKTNSKTIAMILLIASVILLYGGYCSTTFHSQPHYTAAVQSAVTTSAFRFSVDNITEEKDHSFTIDLLFKSIQYDETMLVIDQFMINKEDPLPLDSEVNPQKWIQKGKYISLPY